MNHFSFLKEILADETALTKTLDNKTVLTEKGIWQYLQYIKPDEIVSHRLLTGVFIIFKCLF